MKHWFRSLSRGAQLALVIALVVVVGAAAAWILVHASLVTGTAGSLGGVWVPAEDCSVLAGTPGTIACTNYTNQPVSAVVSGVFPNTSLHFRQVFNANRPLRLIAPPTIDVPYATLVDFYDRNSGSGAPSPICTQSSRQLWWTINFNDGLEQGQEVSISVPFQWEACTP